MQAYMYPPASFSIRTCQCRDTFLRLLYGTIPYGLTCPVFGLYFNMHACSTNSQYVYKLHSCHIEPLHFTNRLSSSLWPANYQTGCEINKRQSNNIGCLLAKQDGHCCSKLDYFFTCLVVYIVKQANWADEPTFAACEISASFWHSPN